MAWKGCGVVVRDKKGGHAPSSEGASKQRSDRGLRRSVSISVCNLLFLPSSFQRRLSLSLPQCQDRSPTTTPTTATTAAPDSRPCSPTSILQPSTIHSLRRASRLSTTLNPLPLQQHRRGEYASVRLQQKGIETDDTFNSDRLQPDGKLSSPSPEDIVTTPVTIVQNFVDGDKAQRERNEQIHMLSQEISILVEQLGQIHKSVLSSLLSGQRRPQEEREMHHAVTNSSSQGMKRPAPNSPQSSLS